MLSFPVFVYTEPRNPEHNLDPSTFRRPYLPTCTCAFFIPREVARRLLLRPLPLRHEDSNHRNSFSCNTYKKQGGVVLVSQLPPVAQSAERNSLPDAQAQREKLRLVD